MPNSDGKPEIPSLLQRLSSEEFAPPPHTTQERKAIAQLREESPDAARRINRPLADYWSMRTGTAAALRGLNHAVGREFYRVPPEAIVDQAAADEALGGDETVIDVQTHFAHAEGPLDKEEPVVHFLWDQLPDRMKGLDMETAFDLPSYLSNVFLDSETAVAVLSHMVPPDGNDEVAAVRALVERFGGEGRLLTHAKVHPDRPGIMQELDAIWERCAPEAFKIYTGEGNWFLDDEEVGLPFLEKCTKLGAKRVAMHKGLSRLAPTNSPRDVGPAAKAFPDLDFLVYHSGYDIPAGDYGEGPYREADADDGTNRLIKSLRDAGVGPGGNVYAELGALWFLALRRPQEAAHILGKLLLNLGEDNILWGTDCIWFGSSQPLIDAFRAFQIPQEYSERYGYPQLTPEVKAKILGLNAARVYGIDMEKTKTVAQSDDLSWARAAMKESISRAPH